MLSLLAVIIVVSLWSFPGLAGEVLPEVNIGGVSRYVESVQYVQMEGVDPHRHSLDIYALPDSSNAPVMVWIHGGGWWRGDKSYAGRKAEFFLANGWVFVSINYRLLPEGQHPRNVEDVSLTIGWVYRNIERYGGDNNSISIMGHSAGAHLASLVATDSRYLRQIGLDLSIIRAVVLLDSAAYDIPAVTTLRGTAGFHSRVFTDNPDTQRDASPIYHIAENIDIPPFQLFYTRGSRPERVNPVNQLQARAFADALVENGILVELVDATDRTHSEINRWFGDPEDFGVTHAVLAFLNEILDN